MFSFPYMVLYVCWGGWLWNLRGNLGVSLKTMGNKSSHFHCFTGKTNNWLIQIISFQIIISCNLKHKIKHCKWASLTVAYIWYAIHANQKDCSGCVQQWLTDDRCNAFQIKFNALKNYYSDLTRVVLAIVYLNLGSCVVTTPTSSSEGLKSIERTVDRQEIAVWRKETNEVKVIR